jgi:hypothetical protein
MSDKIVSMQSNSDGSFDFGFLFDGGNGITGETDVHVPAPIGTPAVYAEDGATVITPAVPAVLLAPQAAATAALSIAAAQKAVWLASVNGANIIGNIVLPQNGE